jgi:uracil phosphoribosyltransferase
MRIPPASATERLNDAVDRAERYMALADPMMRTMDAMLSQLEALVATGNDVFNAVSSVPGVSALGRLASRSPDPPPGKRPSKGRGAREKS